VSVASLDIPAYVTGEWSIDPVHSEISFSVRHLMVTRVRGRFTAFSGRIVTDSDPLKSSVVAEIDASSIDTKNADRDSHLRSSDFLDVAAYPTITFRSTEIRPLGQGYLITGELTLHGVTKTIALETQVEGPASNGKGGTVVGFTATTEINRRDFGVTISLPLEGGGVVVGDQITIQLDIEAVLNS